VPEYDYLSARELPAEPDVSSSRLSAVVHHGDRHARDLELQYCWRSPGRHVRTVVVAEHSPHGSVLGEFFEHARDADVTGVQDQIR
jgi:hypothetical protein